VVGLDDFRLDDIGMGWMRLDGVSGSHGPDWNTLPTFWFVRS